MIFNWQPQGLDLKNNYNAIVNNAGNYSLPTQDVGVKKEPQKAMGDYSFLKESNAFVPDTEFAQNIANYNNNLSDKSMSVLGNALSEFTKGSDNGMNTPQITQGGFKFSNGQINPVSMLQAPQMQNSRLFDYLTM